MDFLVNLNSIQSVKTFVENVNMYKLNVTACNNDGNYEVNGSSVMALFSLDLSKPILIHIDDEEDEESAKIFKSKINKFVVE